MSENMLLLLSSLSCSSYTIHSNAYHLKIQKVLFYANTQSKTATSFLRKVPTTTTRRGSQNFPYKNPPQIHPQVTTKQQQASQKKSISQHSIPKSQTNISRRTLFLELANFQEIAEEADSSHQKLVLTLYEALNSRDSDTVVKILASDLEWWFHGPPSHQFLMRTLTGDSTAVDTFRFIPQSLVSFGSTVIVEGCDISRAISWVHALTLADGIITQVREYFNTSLTVTRFAERDSEEIVPTFDSGRFPCVWESSVSDRVGKSVPGLVLAI